MTFEEVLDQAIDMLRRRGRVTYRALKRQFDLDDAYLDDLKEELIEGQQVAVDEHGKVLVWIGEAVLPPALPPAAVSASELSSTQGRAPLSYTPPHLAEKILTSRRALEGERKQITVLFADLKGSTELNGKPGAGRRYHGPVRRPGSARRSRRTGLLRRPGHAGRHAPLR